MNMQQQVQFIDFDAEIERAIQSGDLKGAMYTWCDSYSRLPVLLDLWRTMRISTAEAIAAIGEIWSSCDNIGEHSNELFVLLAVGEGGERKELMTEDEQEAYAKLPETVRVYRGCYDFNRDGFSWSLDKAVAERFPVLNRYCHKKHQPLLLTMDVPKSAILAVKLDRHEQEVIFWPYEYGELIEETPLMHEATT